ncbi:hypothetical protein ACWGKS_29265 [Nocardiopsis sp. NPDC055879]
MAKFEVGDWVYVPSRLLPNPESRNFALTRAKVRNKSQRSVWLDKQDYTGNDIRVSTKLIHGDHLGITIFRVGDLVTEEHNLDPLAKSTLHYLRLFLEPDLVRLREVRTSVEIRSVWKALGNATSHVVMVGHGSECGMGLLDRSEVIGGDDLGDLLDQEVPTERPKYFISMSCLTGRAEFAREFSAKKVCKDYLAPFQSVHSASASLFVQSFFANHFLNGHGVTAAHRRARAAVGANVSFRHWRDGKLKPVLPRASGGSY